MILGDQLPSLVPKRFGEVALIFYLNPRAEQNLRNGGKGDKMS